MDENKNLTPENEPEIEAEAETEAEAENAAVSENEPEVKEKATKKPAKNKKIKNQALFKKGSYSLALTAAVLAAIVIFNVLIGVLGERFHLEIDMTGAKVNSISKENINYIKDIDSDISITVCASEEDYASYMAYYAQQYGVYDNNASDYYNQTVKLIKQYASYNDRISVKFIDTQDSEFTAIASKYSTDTINYGDIVVAGTVNGNERHKIVGFESIYELYEDSSYSTYSAVYTVSGNNVETAITSAIAYVTATETKKIAFVQGHSSEDYTASYKKLLSDNNFVCEEVTDAILTAIPDDCDAVAIVAPSSDFIASEIEVISDFLDNGGKYNKGLVFFADINAPYLTNLYDFLAQWGISVEEGVVYETGSSNHMPNDNLTLGTYSSDEDDITKGMSICITGRNVPMDTLFKNSDDGREVKILMSTPGSAISAPVGTGPNWDGAGSCTQASFASAIQSQRRDYTDDNEEISNYVFAFSSTDFIESQYAEESSVSNKDLVLAATERALNAEDTGIKFISKVITNESYSNLISESSANLMRALFMIILPLAVLAVGIFVYVKRRNA